jgi:hypothetical protein
MIEPTIRPISGTIPSAQLMLMPKIAANPVMALKTIAIQGFSFLRLDKTANSMLISATPPNRTRMVATSAAKSSMFQLSQVIAVIG